MTFTKAPIDSGHDVDNGGAGVSKDKRLSGFETDECEVVISKLASERQRHREARHTRANGTSRLPSFGGKEPRSLKVNSEPWIFEYAVLASFDVGRQDIVPSIFGDLLWIDVVAIEVALQGLLEFLLEQFFETLL